MYIFKPDIKLRGLVQNCDHQTEHEAEIKIFINDFEYSNSKYMTKIDDFLLNRSINKL